MARDDLFERIFCSLNSDGQPLLEERDIQLALFIYNAALEEFGSGQEDSSVDDCADAFSDLVFANKLEATRQNCERIVEQFRKTKRARVDFLKNFQKWAPACKEHVKLLRETAAAIHTDKFNSDIAKLVGSVVGVIGGIALALSYFTPMAAVTVPLSVGGAAACGLGGAVTVGATGTEIALLKVKLDEAKEILKKQEENFSLMAHWFSLPAELQATIDSLVNHKILKEIWNDFKEFLTELNNQANEVVGKDYDIELKEFFKASMRKMNESGQIKWQVGDVLKPIVLSFIFLVCVLKGKNRIILDCILINQRLAISLLTILDLGVEAGQLVNGLLRGAAESGDEFFKLAFSKFLVGLGLFIDLLNVVLNSIDIHNRVEPKQSKEIKKAAEQLENTFLAIESVYNETKKLENGDPAKEARWTAIVVESVPDTADLNDIKLAVQIYLPDVAHGSIKLHKLPTKGNNYLVKIPAGHSERLVRQSQLMIKEKRCKVIR